jgi:hypothetical protein
MPTGYTECVGNGKVKDFSKFAMNCARAFGACITMRDEPFDAPIPEIFKPNPYYKERTEEDSKDLKAIENMSEKEIKKAIEEEFKKDLDSYNRRLKAKREIKKNYEKMLIKVGAWRPPTEDHIAMKNFMIEQLTSSIDSDCSEEYMQKPEKLQPEEWRKVQIKELKRSLEYCKKAWEEECDRSKTRTEWVENLRKSLKD